MLLFVHFGWGKPVVFDPFNLRNPRRDSAVISIAGPMTNFVTAIIGAVLLRLLFTARLAVISSTGAAAVVFVISALLEPVIIFNVSLGVFNLIPIHPLDGFKIVEGALPDRYARQWHELERYGLIFLLFLAFPILGSVSPISRFISPIISGILYILLPGASVI
jgi:Zn-dependent protease